MTYSLLDWSREVIRETFEGAREGQGTLYLDKDGGVRTTLRSLTAAQASKRVDGHPSIAAHARHMAFHLRAVAEWILGVRTPRDWAGSFEPHSVTEEEWLAVQKDLEAARAQLTGVLESLTPEQLVENGAGIGAIAHLAYHLGAIRQLRHLVK